MHIGLEDYYDLTVTDIKFVVKREPNKKWILSQRNYSNHYTLAIALTGKAFYKGEKNSFTAEKGDILFFKKGEIHSAKSSQENPWSFISVAFDCMSLSQQSFLQGIPTVNKSLFFENYELLFKELYQTWEARKNGFKLKCRGLICNLLYLIIKDISKSQTKSSTHSDIAKIKTLLSENYDKNYTVQELSAIANLSPSHFRLLFKKQVGETTTQYHNKIKIIKACELIDSGILSVTEIAYSIGFDDIYYFSRLFKKTTGITPSVYIKKHYPPPKKNAIKNQPHLKP